MIYLDSLDSTWVAVDLFSSCCWIAFGSRHYRLAQPAHYMPFVVGLILIVGLLRSTQITHYLVGIGGQIALLQLCERWTVGRYVARLRPVVPLPHLWFFYLR